MEALFNPAPIVTQKGRELFVRQFGWKDFEPLVRMYKSFEPKRVAQGLPPPDVPRIAHWLSSLSHKSQSLLATREQDVVGHTILVPISRSSVEFTIFVHQDYREEGLGTVLSRHALAWASEIGFEFAYLTTEMSNFRALRLFRKLGFQTTSGFGDELEMKLRLAASTVDHLHAA